VRVLYSIFQILFFFAHQVCEIFDSLSTAMAARATKCSEPRVCIAASHASRAGRWHYDRAIIWCQDRSTKRSPIFIHFPLWHVRRSGDPWIRSDQEPKERPIPGTHRGSMSAVQRGFARRNRRKVVGVMPLSIRHWRESGSSKDIPQNKLVYRNGHVLGQR
jgi:hypothetical protein